jgi:CHAD domain-containing protein
VKAKLENLSRSLQAKRRSLQQHYNAEDLHQLRVGLRRMRSFLKSRSGSKARHLRHELGQLADATNAARDWDTLLAKTIASLRPGQLRLLEDNLRQSVSASHQPALEMLRSNQWCDVMRDWETYIRRHPPSQSYTKSNSKEQRQARDRVAHAWQRARLTDTSRNWHKLRIAVKDLRYRLEADSCTAKNTDASRLLRRCKQLQTLLGDWHDTVVHLQLLREMAERYDPESDIGALRALRGWCHELEAEGQQCLEQTRENFASAELASLSGAVEAVP